MSVTPPSLDDLRRLGKPAIARALAMVETHGDDPSFVVLLDAAWAEPKGHVVGITGPPGVGKSSLINAMIAFWRACGQSVAVVAVDPSSKRSGGALLGDRTRIIADPEDDQIFIRSMAARDRLGGLADITFPAVVLLRALFDRIIVETVGVGQSETEISDLADTVVLCVQPGSGDALQFMKAGIVEVPDIAVVTKADLGAAAVRARSDLESALDLVSLSKDGRTLSIFLVSIQQAQGLDALMASIDEHRVFLDSASRLGQKRQGQAEAFLVQMIRDGFGREGVSWARRAGRFVKMDGRAPFAVGHAIVSDLRAKLT